MKAAQVPLSLWFLHAGCPPRCLAIPLVSANCVACLTSPTPVVSVDGA